MLTHRDTHAEVFPCQSKHITRVQCPSVMMKLHGNNLQHLHRGHCCGANASLPRTYRLTPLPQCILGVWVTKGTKKHFS